MKMREKKRVPMSELFPDWQTKFPPEETYEVFADEHPLTPTLDPFYSFPEMETIELLTVLEKPVRNNVWMHGLTGAGKSSLVRSVAAVLKAAVYEFYADSNKKPSDLIGRPWITQTKDGKEMSFRYGIIPKWLRNGGILLINEYDLFDTDVVNIFKPVLEYPRRLCVVENEDEVIEGHPDCRLVVTCNTQGRGDDSGMFVNAHVHSIADLRRFDAFIEVDYLEEDQEKRMLTRRFPDVPAKVIENVVKVANQTREAFKRGSLARVLSPAECINWVENYRLFATGHHAARVSFLNAYENEARQAVRDMITVAFGNEDSEMLNDPEAAARAADKSTDESTTGA